jgi:hypothetical protein
VTEPLPEDPPPAPDPDPEGPPPMTPEVPDEDAP